MSVLALASKQYRGTAMNIMKTILTVLVLIVFSIINVDLVFSQDDKTLETMADDKDLEQEFKWLKAETYVITASKVKENIKKAPASISVITDRQIRQMGARHLADVLRTVPGIQVFYNSDGSSILNIRRVFGGAPSSSKVLFMLNSYPLNSTFFGGATWDHDTLALDNVKRIEVIRGPGSALYGANAYIAVINVITKDAEDIDGFEITARGGSWDTQQYNLVYGKTFSDLEVAFNFNYFKTHGFRGRIEEDSATQFDQLTAPFRIPFGIPPASLAPGRMAGNDEKYDAQLTLKYKGFTFDGRYVDRERDLPVGWQNALNHKSITSNKNYYLNLCYEKNIREGLDLSGKVYSTFEERYSGGQIYPPGFIVFTPVPNPAPPPPFLPAIMPNGMIVAAEQETYRIGVEIQSIYKINDKNSVVAGATYEEMKVYDTWRGGNYLPDPSTPSNVIIPLPSVQKWPDAFTEGTEKINFKAVFIEDIWEITDNLRLTTGVRYDWYSNFGGEASPRVGLTWEFKEGYDLKLLYGHAFRAPTFVELYNPGLGDPDLDPEKRDTYEASLGAVFNSSLSARITGYYSKAKDIIVGETSQTRFKNFAKGRSKGFEVEIKYDFGRGTYLAGNYNYGSTQSAEIPTGDILNGTSPRHTGNIMANIRLSRHLNVFTNCHFEDDFPRNFGDNRDDMSGFAIVDTTLIARKFLRSYEGLEFRASIYNLLDKEYASPQDTRLQDDLPMPGINFLLEVKIRF